MRKTTGPHIGLSALFVRREHTGTTTKLHTIETFERDTQLKEATYERREEDMLRYMSEEDLLAKDAVYHSTYISSYLSKNLKAKTPSSTVTTRCLYDTAFYSLIEETDNDLMLNKKALLLSTPVQRYNALLPAGIGSGNYKNARLRSRPEKHYGFAVSRPVYYCFVQHDHIG